MCMSQPKTPDTPPLPPPAPPPPTAADPAVARARSDNRQRAALALGRDKTILTSGQGLSDSTGSGKKTLLGQ
jgi:hypothetical protein